MSGMEHDEAVADARARLGSGGPPLSVAAAGLRRNASRPPPRRRGRAEAEARARDGQRDRPPLHAGRIRDAALGDRARERYKRSGAGRGHGSGRRHRRRRRAALRSRMRQRRGRGRGCGRRLVRVRDRRPGGADRSAARLRPGADPALARALRRRDRPRRPRMPGPGRTAGASPGDDEHDEPYLYVGPWSEQPPGPLWNANGFAGAELGYAELLAARRSGGGRGGVLRRAARRARRPPGASRPRPRRRSARRARGRRASCGSPSRPS